MSVQFEEDSFISRNFPPVKEKGFSFVDFLVRKGIVRDEHRAQMVLSAVSIIILIICGIFMVNIMKSDLSKTVSYDKLPLKDKLLVPEEVRDSIDAEVEN